MGDPFGPARRALFVGPLTMVLGGGLIAFGIAGDGLAWILCLLGGIVALLGFLRFVGGVAVLALERRRERLLRSGTPATATVKSVRQLGTKSNHALFEATLEIAEPDGTTTTVKRRGAVEPQYAAELAVGATLPVRIDPDNPSAVAVAWGEV